MIFIIVLLVVGFLYWSLVPAKSNQTYVDYNSEMKKLEREDLLTQHILLNIEKSLANSNVSLLNDEEKGLAIYYSLEKFKSATIEASPQLAKNFSIPMYRVHEIIDDIFDRLMKNKP